MRPSQAALALARRCLPCSACWPGQGLPAAVGVETLKRGLSRQAGRDHPVCQGPGAAPQGPGQLQLPTLAAGGQPGGAPVLGRGGYAV